MTPEEVLAKAAEDIARYGHAKETFYNSSGEMSWEVAPACALGAIARVTGSTSVRQGGIVMDDVFASEAVHKLAAKIRAKDGRYALADNYQTVTGYNDSDSTTAEDMILTFKEAAHG